jgi:hypothetical protein
LTGRAARSLTVVVAIGFGGLVGLGACGGRAAPAAAPAVLVVDCAVDDAALWIDERFVAEIAQARGGVRLPAGRHRVEVRHDAYHAFLGEVALRPGQRRTLPVPLAERLD